MKDKKVSQETDVRVEIWSLRYTVLSMRRGDKAIHGSVNFQARDDQEAKVKILEILKRKLARVKWNREKLLCILAAPYRKANNPEKCLDGNRMIRNKDSYSGKRILRVRNSELAFVQGFGPEAVEKLSE